MSPFSYFDHTADVGVEVSAGSIEEIFAESGRALFNLIVDLDQLDSPETEIVEMEGTDEISLLIDWLNELIFLFDARGWLFREFRVAIANGRPDDSSMRLTAECRGERDSGRQIEMGLKSATYHGASISEDGTWQARFILDV